MANRLVEKHLHEVPAERRILDVRPWTVKAQEWLSFKENFTIVVVTCCAIPVVVPLLLLPSAIALLTVTVVNRSTRAVMPLRYPAGSFEAQKDRSGKQSRPVPGVTDNEGKQVHADGIMMLGNLESSSVAARGREIWLSDDDLRKHLLILGATGSGKSETLKSICYNALCWSSGFFIADGKADNKLATDVNTLARRFGVDDNFLCLNFLLGGSTPQQVANSRRKRSNSINPFRTSDADTIIQMGANLMPKVEGEGKQWQEKALSLWRAEVNALCFKRDHDGFELSIDTFLDYLSLDKIEELYIEGFDRRDPQTHVWPYGFDGIKAYLESGLPGYSVEKLLRKHNRGSAPAAQAAPPMGRPPASNDQSAQASEQHGYRANQMQPALGLLANTYGHIFKHRYPEIDMVDVVLNDRILVTLIPPLEKSSQEAENLGKLTIACLRVMMARNLGTDIEGTREELLDSKATAAPYPYVVALDELGYFFSDGIAVMFAQARSLAFCMIALAQDLEKLTEGNRAAEAGAMMGNQVSKFFMRIDDAQKTWNLVKEVLGKVPVAVVRSFVRKGGGWERSEEAAIEFVEPVSLQDLQSMKAGEGVLSAIGQRLHLRSLYVGDALAKNRSFRLCRFLQVPPPSQEAIDRYSDPIDLAADPVEKGKRMMKIMSGESSVDYFAQPDTLLAEMGQTAAGLPETMSAEERGITLYMAARAAILKARRAAATTPGGEKPEDQSVDLAETAIMGADPLPFQRKDAAPIVEILQQEVARGESRAASLLDSLDLLPGLGGEAGSSAARPARTAADENPAVWDQMPGTAIQREAEERMHGEAPPAEDAAPADQSAAADPMSPALPFLSPAAAREAPGVPIFDLGGRAGQSGAPGIEGFDIPPRGDAPDAGELLGRFGAFSIRPDGDVAADREARQQGEKPLRLPFESLPGSRPVSASVQELPQQRDAIRSDSVGSAAEAPEWNASLGWAFKRLIGVDPQEVSAAGPSEPVRELPDIPLDADGRVDIPVDDQGLMIGMGDEVVDRVRRLEELINQPAPDVSMATLEAEIAIQVTPPSAPVVDNAGQQMTEDDVASFFDELAGTLKG